ncbi:tyrosine kinase domain protein [Rhizoctonia solani 123E]|uniref:Tyrosine kinase domain protein n=1 Tax=Rhizoctonia solani 123E TaxID=1423351 RepID=A0A074SEP1_9AGAM|nr:tyrosine kinase domain protein [Rhizoctonia solani 123E]
MDKLFVDSNGTTKIGEFGLACLVTKFAHSAPGVSQYKPILIRWSSPELLGLKRKPRSTASDIWAAGCTLFEVSTFVVFCAASILNNIPRV